VIRPPGPSGFHSPVVARFPPWPQQRAWAVSHPRTVAMYLARKHTAATYTEVGQHFGGRNHSTAVAAEKKVRQWLTDDAELALGERRLRVRDIIDLVERDLLR
jgi:chromosomal replication initiator protein